MDSDPLEMHQNNRIRPDIGIRQVGVIGMGRIGKAIAKRCHYGFDMEVVFYNRSKVEDPGMPARQVEMAEAMADGAVAVSGLSPMRRVGSPTRWLKRMRPLRSKR